MFPLKKNCTTLKWKTTQKICDAKYFSQLSIKVLNLIKFLINEKCHKPPSVEFFFEIFFENFNECNKVFIKDHWNSEFLYNFFKALNYSKDDPQPVQKATHQNHASYAAVIPVSKAMRPFFWLVLDFHFWHSKTHKTHRI